MNRALKTLIIAACVVATLLACLIGAAHLCLLSDPGKNFLLRTINTLYPGKISGTRIDISLLTQEVVLENALLRGPEGKQILKAEKVYLRMNLPALLGQELIFETIDIKRPDFVLELDKDNWLNIESAFVEKTPGESPFNVYINSLTCEGGTFAFAGKDGKPIVRLDNFDLLMKSTFETDTTLHLSVPKLVMSLFIAGKKIDLGAGRASCTIFNDRISDIRVATKKGSSTATLTGSLTDMAKKAQLLCNLDLDTDMTDIRDALGLGPDITGRITGRISAIHDYDNPELSLSLGYSGGDLGGLKINKTMLDCTIADRQATIKTLHAEYASGLIDFTGIVDLRKTFPQGYFEGMKEEDTITYDLSINGTSLLISDLPGMPKGLQGKLSPKIDLKGSGVSGDSVRLDAKFAALGQGVSAGSFMKGDELSLAGRVFYKKGLLDINSLTARTRSISAASAGRINLDTRALDGTITLDASQVGDLLKGTGINAYGSLETSSHISGTVEKPLADITAHSERTTINGITLGTIDLKALLGQDGRLYVNSCAIANRTSTIDTKGSIQVFSQFPTFVANPDILIESDLRLVNPSDFVKTLPLSGIVNGQVNIKGPLSNISADMRLDGKELSAAGIPLGDAILTGSLSYGMLTISRLDFTNKNSTMLITGNAALFDPTQKHLNKDPDINLKIQGDNLHVEDFFANAKGTFSISAMMEGSMLHPIGDMAIAAKDLDLGFQRFLKLDIKVQADGGRFWIEPAILTLSDEENLNATGWLSMDGNYSFTLGTQGLSLENLDFMKGHESFKGKVFLNAAGEGNLSNPTLTGRIAAANIKFNDKPLDDLTFSFELQDNKLSMQGNWNFSLKAMHNLSSGDFSTTVLFAETELSPYFVITDKPTFSGRLTGRIDALGNSRSLKDIDLIADISSVDVLHSNKMLLMGRNINGSYKHGLLSIPQTRFTFGDKGWFDLKGSGDSRTSLILDAAGIIPAEVLGMFDEDLSDCSGLIHVSSKITSHDNIPEVSGLLTLEDIAYTIPMNGQRLHTMNGTIRIQDDKIFIDNLTGKIDTGSFKLGGTITRQGFTPSAVDLETQFTALPISIPDMMDLTIDAEASLVSSGSRSLLRSDVIIIDGTYYKDVKLNLLTGVIERILPKQKKINEQAMATRWPYLKNMDLDIAIKRRGEMKVENNISELYLNPDLKIIGTVIKPVLNGRIAVTEGTVTFQNNDFTVTRGIIDFLNPYKTEPTVDIKGETKVRDWTIDLTIEGGFDNLKFKLNSTPSEEPADILSLLIVGKTSRELTQGQTGVTVSPTAMGAEILASTYGGQIKKATTLDILTLKSSEFSTSDKGESLKLTLGKELSRRLTLEYQVETRNTQTIQRGIAEYKIFENLIVNGYQGSDGIFGSDIQLRYEFR
jgi:translocation and assembly module TamB